MFSSRFQDLAEAIDSAVYSTQEAILLEDEALQIALQMLINTSLQNGIIYVIGNGGSAGIASHFSTDLMKTLQMPSQTLFDSNLMTCLSNDSGYENVFSYPLEKLLKSNDLLVAISSSGKSANILEAVNIALSRDVSVMTFSGFLESNPLRKLGQLNFWINRSEYGLVETAHFFLLHTIIDVGSKFTSLEYAYSHEYR